jgi:hypothetical protein
MRAGVGMRAGVVVRLAVEEAVVEQLGPRGGADAHELRPKRLGLEDDSPA